MKMILHQLYSSNKKMERISSELEHYEFISSGESSDDDDIKNMDYNQWQN